MNDQVEGKAGTFLVVAGIVAFFLILAILSGVITL